MNPQMGFRDRDRGVFRWGSWGPEGVMILMKLMSLTQGGVHRWLGRDGPGTSVSLPPQIPHRYGMLELYLQKFLSPA